MAQVITFGCRLNAYESEIIKEKLKDQDNIIVVNTCAVTGEAERQCRQMIRKLRQENPDSKIIVTGCAAQISPETYAAMDEVDLVLGNKEKTEIQTRLNDLKHQNKQQVSDIFAFKDYDHHIITGFEGRERAFVEIQQGCDHRCTYCIIPYGRGNNRSVPEAEIIKQIRVLIDQGFNEICLTGVDICSYKPSFSALVEKILQTFPNLPSLQFGSLDPAAVDDKFIELFGKHKNMFHNLHLSIQSGDDTILKRMARRHRRADVITLCQKLRKVRPDVTFSADFICGFPTETEENFQNTIKLVQEAGISKLHVFPYSERSGTPAAKMPQIPMSERKDRARRLREYSTEGEKTND